MSAQHSRRRARDHQQATRYFSNGPFSAHSAITCAVIRGSDDFYQTTATILGGHRLAELLNHVDNVVSQYTSDITPNSQCDVREIVASAVARSLGWQLELAHERKQRLEWEAQAKRRETP
jgi:hypothetical protein